MSTEAVKWAMDDAPMLRTDKGKPDTTARHVLQALAEHAHKDGSNARPSVLRIQYRTGYDRRTVQRALRRLEAEKLIAAMGVVNGCTSYTLDLAQRRPASDWAALEAEEEEMRRATAERVRRHRAKRVTHAESVTETHSDDVTEPDVTHSASGRNAFEVRDVTHSDDVRNALNAARTINEPSVEPPENQPPDGRRPTTGSGTDRTSGSAATDDEPYEKIPATDISRVVAGLPAAIRDALTRTSRRTPLMIDATIRSEINRGITPERLIARAKDRWHLRGYDDAQADGRIRRPLGIAHALLRNDCTSPRCDDGTDLDTGQPCRTCERARDDHRASA